MDWDKNKLNEYLDRPEIAHDKYKSEIKRWKFLKNTYLLVKNVFKK